MKIRPQRDTCGNQQPGRGGVPFSMDGKEAEHRHIAQERENVRSLYQSLAHAPKRPSASASDAAKARGPCRRQMRYATEPAIRMTTKVFPITTAESHRFGRATPPRYQTARRSVEVRSVGKLKEKRLWCTSAPCEETAHRWPGERSRSVSCTGARHRPATNTSSPTRAIFL